MSELETTINLTQGDKTMTVFSAQRKWINKLLKYTEDKDSGVKITHKNNDGSIIFEVPVNYLKISPPRKTVLTDEQKTELSRRLKEARKSKGCCEKI